jgi:hypothetical protein
MISDHDLAALAAKPKAQARPLLEVEFEALIYMLRDGPSALTRQEVVERAERLSAEQLEQAVARLIRMSPSNETPWKPKDIRALEALT